MVGNLDIIRFAASLSIFSDDLKTAHLSRIESIKGTAPVIVCLSAGRIKGRLKNSVAGLSDDLGWVLGFNNRVLHQCPVSVGQILESDGFWDSRLLSDTSIRPTAGSVTGFQTTLDGF